MVTCSVLLVGPWPCLLTIFLPLKGNSPKARPSGHQYLTLCNPPLCSFFLAQKSIVKAKVITRLVVLEPPFWRRLTANPPATKPANPSGSKTNVCFSRGCLYQQRLSFCRLHDNLSFRKN
ncbi:hypothetical protein DL96DRAFT_669927 [Flagelloscypha sp. PMI_526]|nr:hypothetical protein DL96DRAFT_669927 [Flagelloscypha sp. PMI_526]